MSATDTLERAEQSDVTGTLDIRVQTEHDDGSVRFEDFQRDADGFRHGDFIQEVMSSDPSVMDLKINHADLVSGDVSPGTHERPVCSNRYCENWADECEKHGQES